MSAPTYCMIFEAIGPYSAIAKVAMVDVKIALDAGYRVTVVAHRLDESLHNRVEWLKLYVPPRLFAVKWLTARRFVKRALAGRTFDLVHAHQPQTAALSDVFQCHYLTRMAYERNCLSGGSGIRSACTRLQERLVLGAEDRYYGNWNPGTRMLFDSDLTRSDFVRLYGAPPMQDVLLYACPPYRPAALAERRAARRALVGDAHTGPVIGFLGGGNRRKGSDRLIKALESEQDILLLMGGAFSDGVTAPALGMRFRSLGLVQDTAQFYAACDVFAVPSLYEPFGMVAFEAAARGVPVVMTPEVGALPHLLEYGAGREWKPGEPLGPLVRALVADRAGMQAGAERMTDCHSEARYGERLLAVYEQILKEKGIEPPFGVAAGSV